jgi:hypothetical protein
MIKQTLLLTFTFFFNNCCFSQKTIDFNDLINKKNLFNHVSVLAHDSLEGRNTGEKGQQKAASFLVKKIKEYGLQTFENNEYLLPVNLIYKTKSANLKLNGQNLGFIKNFSFSGEYQQHKDKITTLKVIKSSDLNYLTGADNYAVLFESFESFDPSIISDLFKGYLFIFIKNYDTTILSRKPLKGLLINEPAEKPINFYVDYNCLNIKLKKELTSKKEVSLNIEFELNPNQEKLKSENIHAYIEGTDSVLKKEIVIVSAHYDHIGVKKGEVFNGADDNASGSATILEMARIFQQLKNEGTQFKRSILFLWFTGEEHGLLGSAYYAKNPIISLNNTIANLNIDMIGRADSLTEKEQFKVYIIGSDKLSQDLHQINEKSKNNLLFDYKYNDENDPLRLYYRSDHYNFANKGIPSIFYFGGFHEDYHKSTDDLEKINFNKMKEVASCVSNTCLSLINTNERPTIKK